MLVDRLSRRAQRRSSTVSESVSLPQPLLPQPKTSASTTALPRTKALPDGLAVTRTTTSWPPPVHPKLANPEPAATPLPTRWVTVTKTSTGSVALQVASSGTSTAAPLATSVAGASTGQGPGGHPDAAEAGQHDQPDRERGHPRPGSGSRPARARRPAAPRAARRRPAPRRPGPAPGRPGAGGRRRGPGPGDHGEQGRRRHQQPDQPLHRPVVAALAQQPHRDRQEQQERGDPGQALLPPALLWLPTCHPRRGGPVRPIRTALPVQRR
jgi:hypothetical protein